MVRISLASAMARPRYHSVGLRDALLWSYNPGGSWSRARSACPFEARALWFSGRSLGVRLDACWPAESTQGVDLLRVRGRRAALLVARTNNSTRPAENRSTRIRRLRVPRCGPVFAAGRVKRAPAALFPTTSDDLLSPALNALLTENGAQRGNQGQFGPTTPPVCKTLWRAERRPFDRKQGF